MITANDIATLWVKMTATFGYRFTETYGRRDPGVWREVLRDLMPADLENGFRRMLRSHHRSGKTAQVGMAASVVAIWPPNALEFRQYCEQARQDGGLPTPHEAFIEAKTNSYLTQPRWSHALIQAASDCLYQNKTRKSASDPVYEDDYPAFKHYYVALRDAYLAFPETSRHGCDFSATSSFSRAQKAAERPSVEKVPSTDGVSVAVVGIPRQSVMTIPESRNEETHETVTRQRHEAEKTPDHSMRRTHRVNR